MEHENHGTDSQAPARNPRTPLVCALMILALAGFPSCEPKAEEAGAATTEDGAIEAPTRPFETINDLEKPAVAPATSHNAPPIASAPPASDSPAATDIPTTTTARILPAGVQLPKDFGTFVTPFVIAGESTPLMPSDFALGALADYRSGSGGAQAIVRARQALDGLMTRILAPELYESERFFVVQARFRTWLSSGEKITGYRLGAPSMPDPAIAYLNLRLYSAIGRAEGEIVLVLRAGVWYVQDINVDPDGLAAPWTPPQATFTPDYYLQFEP